jgi:uncharacterized integral membrane protein
MSFLRYIFLGALGLILLVLALANRQMVTLSLLPDTFADFMGTGAIEMPLFAVIFLAIGLGLLVGFVWEWLREYKHRAEASRQRAAKEKLEKQLTRASGGTEEDEVLAILDGPRT